MLVGISKALPLGARLFSRAVGLAAPVRDFGSFFDLAESRRSPSGSRNLHVDPGEEGSPMGDGRRKRRGRKQRGRGRPRRDHAATLQGARAVARERFGIARLRSEQARAIEAVLAGRDALVVLPTGYGKSLIYQVSGLLLDHPVAVVSPLISLMRDQERKLHDVGAPVVRLDSTLRVAARGHALARITKGGRLLVLTTPETFESESARPAFESARLGLLVVDEAHCISEWGHDFRPAYLRLDAVRRELGVPTVLGLTATATPRVTANIVERLGLDDPLVVRAPPHRKNLRFSATIAPGDEKFSVTGKLVKKLPRPAIIYCATTRAVDETHAALHRARIPSARYHGGMSTAERTAAQRRYMRPKQRLVMVATSAFGMGIDKPDIRSIVHFQAPGSLEQYVQEAGRAGRDGKPARCILLFDPDDLRIHEHLQRKGRPSGRQLQRLGEALAAWVAEDKPVATKELALSASVPATTTASLCAQLESAGLLRLDGRRWVARVSADQLSPAIEELAGRFETLRREDARRLRSVEEYARTTGCRSVFIRRYFGEDDPPRCGVCDRCRERQG
jgi:ATP-dependent DNA helicase RecQ